MSSGAVLTQSGFNSILSQVFGTATINQFQFFVIGTSNQTPVTTDTGLIGTTTNWTAGGTSFKSYVTTYPQFDTTNQKVTLRGYISAAEATGVVIYEYADVNNAATKVPAGRFVWNDAITKTASNQLTIITQYKRN